MSEIDTPVYKRWWLVLIGGAVILAVGIGAGVVLGSRAADEVPVAATTSTVAETTTTTTTTTQPTTTTVPPEILVTMSYEFDDDTWRGLAGSEFVELLWSNDLYGWIGRLGPDSVSLLRSSAVWTGQVGSESVVLNDNVSLGNSDVEDWTGQIGTRPISLSGGYWATGGVEGFIGSIPVSVTCDEEDETGRSGSGTGPLAIGALLPILCESYGWD